MSSNESEHLKSIGGLTAVDGTTGGSAPDLLIDGSCCQKTVMALDLPVDSIARIRDQSIQLLSEVVQTYERDVAPGEVGLMGSGVASDAKPAGDFGPTGLMYGRIQSGKTAAMITFSALALDNGFRIVIVLTTNFVELVTQTAERFGAVARALVYASTERDAWESDVDNIRKHVGKRGVVIVCAKEARHLDSARKLVNAIGGGGYPAIILDDEADQATLDNNARKRSRARLGEEVSPTKIHDRIADIRRAVPHHVFLQVTATPFALLLQNVESPLRPQFTHVLEPGSDYTGGEDFFSAKQLRFEDAEPAPPVIYVDENESEDLQTCEGAPPEGFERAIALYLVSAATQILKDPAVAKKSQNFLCHTSHKKSEHERLDKLLRSFLSKFEDELESGGGRATALVHSGYEELRKTVADLPSTADIIEDILDRLPRRRIRVINSEGKGTQELAGVPNFIIGGNIVGRGLTIPNLLVTYYLRRPKISQMDTMLQHARMFGYRAPLMPLTRVFLPRSLAIRFHSIHRAEEELRELLPKSDALSSIPVQVVGELRATRYGVLDTGSVVSLRSGAHVFPYEPPYAMPVRRRKQIEKIYHDVFGNDFEQQTNPKDATQQLASVIPSKLAAELCCLFEQADWGGTVLSGIIESTWHEVMLRFRPMNRSRQPGQTSTDLPTGAVSGLELRDARAAGIPTLFLFRQVTSHAVWNDKKFWYPSLVFPSNMRNIVYNDSVEE